MTSVTFSQTDQVVGCNLLKSGSYDLDTDLTTILDPLISPNLKWASILRNIEKDIRL